MILKQRNTNKKTVNNDKNIVFVTKDSVPILTRKSDIILSPEFYWVIKKKLHVKHLWQVKKICPSLFDGMLSAGNYEYYVVKTEDAFLLFAYDSHYILSHLKQMGMNTDLIDTIRFAQNEFPKNKIYSTGDKILIAVNDIFMFIPKTLVNGESIEIKYVHFEQLSNIKISLNKYNFFMGKRSFNVIVISLTLYMSFMVIEILLHKNSLMKIQNTQSELYQKYNLPSTSWQIEAIKKKLLDKHREQIALRHTLNQMFEIPLAKDDFFTKLYFEKKEISFLISLKDAQKGENIKKNLSQTFTVKSMKIQNNYLNGELLSE